MESSAASSVARFVDSDGEGNKFLTKEDALRRSELVSNVEYKLCVCLRKGGESYLGSVEIAFDLAAPPRDLQVDFLGKSLARLSVNGADVAPGEGVFRGHRITLAAGALNGGARNSVWIEFEASYVTNCAGMQYFRDEGDGEEYLYTNAEPDHAHKWFPCFDQPNLKASYQLLVLAPHDWNVISTCGLESKFAVGGSAGEEWAAARAKFQVSEAMVGSFGEGAAVSASVFPLSQPISTYLYCICAGPYVEFKPDSFGDFKVLMKLYCRKSLAKYVEKIKEEWFRVSEKGITFYE